MPEVVSGLWFVGPVVYFVMAGSVLCVIAILLVVTRKEEKNLRNTKRHQEPHPPT